MTDEDKAIEVDVPLEAPEKVKEVEVKADEAKEKEKPVVAAKEKSGDFDDLKKQYDDLQKRETAAIAAQAQAEQRATQREREIGEANAELTRRGAQAVDSEFHIIANAIAAATAEADAAAGEHQSALETGDAKKATDAQRKIARAEAKLVSLEDGKAALDHRVEQMRRAPAKETRQAPVSTGDHVEDQIARYSPRTQSWLRQHKECVADDKTRNRATGAHFEAIADGYTPDSDAYFEFLDKKLGFAEKKPGAERTTGRAPAAPVSRDTSIASGNLDSQRVKLSGGEQKAAAELGLSLSEYARRKMIMTKEGRYATMAMPSE